MSFEDGALLLARLQVTEGRAEGALALRLIGRVSILGANLTDICATHLSIHFVSKFVVSAHIGAYKRPLWTFFDKVVLEELVWDGCPVAAIHTFEDHARGPIDSILAINWLNWSITRRTLVVNRPVD